MIKAIKDIWNFSGLNKLSIFAIIFSFKQLFK